MFDKLSSILITALLGVILLLGSCEDSSAPHSNATPMPPAWQMVVFVDKTYSNELTPETCTNLLSTIARTYLANIRNGLTAHPYVPRQADFSIVLVHQNTLGSGLYSEFPLRLPAVDSDMGGLSQKEEKKKQQKAVDEWLQACQQSLLDALTLPLHKQTSQHTDLWAAFEVASRQIQPDPATAKYLVFISDMVESMNGPHRRDFHKNPPASREKAIAWAEADFETIQHLYQVDSAALNNARIAIFTPARPMESNDLGTLRYYWEELFRRAGAKEVVWKPLKQMAQPVF